MVKYRSRLEIIADVLAVAKGGAGKTQIMYGANLSYMLLTRYMTDVMDTGLMRTDDEHTYMLTEKGAEFLKEFHGYREDRIEVEKQLTEINNKKALLLNRFLNEKAAH
jgi:predicted transcriptional regulator